MHTFKNLKFEPVPSYKLEKIMPSEITNSITTLRIMSWLFSYHAAHSWQLQDLLGYDSSNTYRNLSKLYKTGMLERASSISGKQHPHIYKISKSNRFSLWLDYLPYRAWIGVTGGRDIYRPSLSLRHNLAAGDIALIAGGVEAISAVLGEPFAASRLMFENVPEKINNRGDAVFVLENGLKVIIEATSTGDIREFVSKMTKWGEVMLATDDPFKVVFVDVAHPTQAKSNIQFIAQAMENLSREHFAHLGMITNDEIDQIKRRIAVTSFTRWIDNGHPTSFFQDLVVYRHKKNTSYLEEFSILNELDHPLVSSTRVLSNYKFLYAIPYELRERNKQSGDVAPGSKHFHRPAQPLEINKGMPKKEPLIDLPDVDLNDRIDSLFKTASQGIELGFPELDE
jgi:hypothetical protein